MLFCIDNEKLKKRYLQFSSSVWAGAVCVDVDITYVHNMKHVCILDGLSSLKKSYSS